MKRFKVPLLVRIIVAILLGLVCARFFPLWLGRVFVTFNDLFGSFLSFIIPLLIIALVAPGIAELGTQAGKLLGITAIIAYGSTVLAGFFGYFSGRLIFPTILSLRGHFISVPVDNTLSIPSYFHIDMPPIMNVMSALVFSFILGIGLATVKDGLFVGVLKELRTVIEKVINHVLIPLLPLFIFGIFLKIGLGEQVKGIITKFVLIIAIIFALSILILIFQFCIAGVVTKKNPFKCLLKMLPAYMTALGTQSSAATIPVTLKQSKMNGVSDEVADFVVPLCATIHMSGSCVKITACALAICMVYGIPFGGEVFTGFIFLLAITMVAAPGVPGGCIMAALGVLASVLGFDETMQGVMIALYIAMDSFGTACNVTGDGAIALIMDKIASKKAD